MTLTPEDIKLFEAPLPLGDHEVRAKGKNKAETKQQWLIYVTQEGIIPLLNRVDPDWSWEVRERNVGANYVSVTGRLTVKGVSRDGTGGSSPNSASAKISEDTEKGAETDALKRAAVKFGIGLYLRSAPMIWIAITDKSWEDEEKALAEVAVWYKRTFGAKQPVPRTEPPAQASQRPQQAARDDEDGSPEAHPIVGNIDMSTLMRRAYDEKLVRGRNHFDNLIKLLQRDGVIRDAMGIDQVLEQIRKHEAAKDLEKEASR